MTKLKNFLKQRLQKLGLRHIVQEQETFTKAGRVFNQYLPPFFAKNITLSKFKNKTLFIRTTNPILASEIQIKKCYFIKKLNQELNTRLIENIKIN